MANLRFVCTAVRGRSYMGAVIYYVVQEFTSLLFLLAYGSAVCRVILLVKLAVSPFHWWILEAARNFNQLYLVAWSMSFQKLPYLPVLGMFWRPRLTYVVLFGIMLVRLQVLAEQSSYKFFLIASTVSTGWICLFLGQRLWRGLICSISYLILSFYYYCPLNRPCGVDASSILAFFNAPVSGVFLAKVCYVTASVDGGFIYLVTLIFSSLVSVAASYQIVTFVRGKGVLSCKAALISLPICLAGALMV